MARYTPIYSEIWFDGRFKGLSDQDRLFFIYSLCSSHSNMLGFYRLPIPYACADLDWLEKKVKDSIARCTEAKRLAYDDTAQVMLVLNYLKWNPIKGSQQESGALSQLAQIPQTSLYPLFFECVERHIPYMLDKVTERIPYPYPIDTVSGGYVGGTVTDTVIDTATDIAFLDKTKKEKISFAPSVRMTQEEYDKLIDRFGEKGTADRIERLSLYKQSKGKKYKCDYSTILNWARKDSDKPMTIQEKNRLLLEEALYGNPTRDNGDNEPA